MQDKLIGRRDALRLGGTAGLLGLGLAFGATSNPVPARAATGKWTDLAPMPTPQCEGTAVVVDGRIHVMGGWKDLAAPYPLVQIYDPATDKWSEGVPLPNPLHHFGAVVLGGKIYVVGGFPQPNRERAATDKVWAFDLKTQKWSAMAPLPEPRGALVVKAIGNLIYVAGGEVARRPGSVTPPGGVPEYQSIAEAAVYDPAANAWKNLPSMRVARNHAYAGVIDDKLYVAGSRDRPKTDIDTLEVFDPKTGAWSDCAPMPTGRSGGNSAVLNGRLYAFGGEGNPKSPVGIYDNVEAYDPRTNTWTRLDPMPHPRHSIQTATIGSRIYIPGGVPKQAGDGALAMMDCFEPG